MEEGMEEIGDYIITMIRWKKTVMLICSDMEI